MSFVSKVLSATLWITIVKWVTSVMGVVSTLILARILTPSDFGLVATATLVTAFFEILSRLGTEEYIIKSTSLTNEDIDTSWTLQLIVKLAISLLILSFSHYASVFFNEPRLTQVLMLLATVPVLVGLNNIGVILAKKEMKFKKIMKLELISKVCSFSLTITLAILIRNYWAFIFGTIFHYFIYTSLTYLFYQYRPKFCLRSFYKQIAFSQWTLLKGMVNYTSGKIDQILITKLLGVIELGAYTISQRIISIPSSLLLSPITDAVFPGLGQLLSDDKDFREKIQKTLFISVLVTTPIATIFFLLSTSIVELFLGDSDKWKIVVNILPLIAIQLINSNLCGIMFGVITLLGRVKFLFKFELVSSILFGVIYYLSLKERGLEAVIISKMVLGFLSSLFLLFILMKHVGISISRFFISVIPIVSCNLLSYCIADYISINYHFSSLAIVNLIIIGVSFFLILFLTLYICVLIFKEKLTDWLFIDSCIKNFYKYVYRKYAK
ncbi:oligosaccharide flippase family protein [Vibrio ziniensis]|uniref:Oligosaccharide flippase family protein n=1 Tax=Vibrio ziniensis TaxID=2711221 RepID=A0A6G7CMM0_9VIBR|nr:oligosaccharide flippase family protein [Vibrio ziniensis]QIH43296.1 oligosaccharide flippase family protein [Vibrio ziniensis]